MSKTRLGTSAVLAAALILSGCGSASPGVAVTVGDEEISSNRVDELADEYCRAVEDQLTGNSQVVPLRYFRGGVAGTLAMRSAAEQLADDYGVEAGAEYDKKVSELRRNVAVLEDEVQEAVVEVETGPQYVEAVQRAVGELLIGLDGGEQGYDAQVERGRAEFEQWLADNEVDFDPGLGIQLADGAIQDSDTALSYPLSDTASAGAAPEPDQAYARALPDSHRCG